MVSIPMQAGKQCACQLIVELMTCRIVSILGFNPSPLLRLVKQFEFVAHHCHKTKLVFCKRAKNQKANLSGIVLGVKLHRCFAASGIK